MAGPAAVTFDLDHTLCEHDQSHDELLTETFERAGVEQYCTPSDVDAIVDDAPTVESDREFFEFCFAEAARRAGANADHAPTLATTYDDLLDHSAVSFRPGAEAALSAVDDRHVALVTNGSEQTQTEKLEALGLTDAFDATVFCDPAAGIHAKPDPAPFERALDALGVEPAETLHVGDSLAADVAGANALGSDSAWVPPSPPVERTLDHEPTHRLSSLADLPSIL
ncbi:HAD family hydrolase [Halomicrococcus sp. NG-SE-24]|uniref:HAD family hydrolase n=1 Tax=Halomicrococcus sp. NG-SE-24 TaxID=3436928 RepID=UPI003D98B6C1